MLVDFTALPARDVYRWMTTTITPRPIAWVSTISAEGGPNLAPFSFFNGISSNPPMLMFVPVNNREGVPKDTVRNLEATKEMVVHIVSADLAAAMNQTAALLPPEESEFDFAGIAQVPSTRVKPPRVAGARVAFECTLHSITKLGEGPGASNVVFASILCAHVADDVVVDGNRVDPGKLDAIGRLGGDAYCFTRDRFEVERP